jgi:hypothetical protein
LHQVPKDRRPVPSPVEERIESTAIYNTHSWTDVLDNTGSAGDGTLQVSAEYLLQRLGEVGTLKFTRSHNAMGRIFNVSKNADVGNVMVAHALSQSLSLTKSEHQEYISRTPMIFKFLNSTKMGRITFRYAGVDWIQGDSVMADTGCDIMLITVSMAKGMKLSIVPSKTKVHTSVSGQSSVLGEVADSFDVILCKGTSDELVVCVGRDTKVKVMVAPDNCIYVVLLCQKFHHACGGYNDPVLNAFVFRPKLLSEGLLNPLVVLDGTAVQIRGNSWESSSHVTIAEVETVHPTPAVDVEDIIPNPSLLDDGDIEPHP